ncbi:MAG: hypothetical protein ACFCVB_14425 [Nodosilinea sp.]
MQSEEFFEDRISLNVSADGYRKILGEYYKLASAAALSESQSLRIYEILQMAEHDSLLSLLINEIDELTYQEQEFDVLDVNSHLDNEASKVQEMIPDDIATPPIDYSLINRELSSLAAARRRSYSHPRVEMLFDATRAEQIKFEKTLSQDIIAMYIYSNNICLLDDRCREYKFNQRFRGRSIAHFFKEESVSIVAVLWLILFLLILL